MDFIKKLKKEIKLFLEIDKSIRELRQQPNKLDDFISAVVGTIVGLLILHYLGVITIN